MDQRWDAGRRYPTIDPMSEFNAWRVFGQLALMLGITLPKKLAQSIRL